MLMLQETKSLSLPPKSFTVWWEISILFYENFTNPPMDPVQIHRARIAKPSHPQTPDPQKPWEEYEHLFWL